MRLFWVVATCCAVACAEGNGPRNPATAGNVNSRYTVESVELTRVEVARLSQPLRERIAALIGARFDQQVIDDLGQRIRHELRQFLVSMRLGRGSRPEMVRVIFELTRKREEVELTIPRLTYHSRQNFSFGLDTGFRAGGNTFRFGAATDNDTLVERFSGIRGGFESRPLAGDRVRLGVAAASYRSQWWPEAAASLGAGAYRSRIVFEPGATIVLAQPLTLQLGVGLERLEFQLPGLRDELASAATMTLRFERRWQLTTGSQHLLEATYGLRSGTRALSSDFLYTRHRARAQYRFRRGRGEISATAEAGILNGRAPLFERFVAGNSFSLRGWSKYELSPLGGDRLVTASVDFRFRRLRLIYDTGSVWQDGSKVRVRHSAAVGVATRGPTSLCAMVAFPIREGPVSPMFITGINF